MKRYTLKAALAYIVPSVLFLGIIVWLCIALGNTSKAAEQSELTAVKTTVENGITLCYAIEGVYPPNIDHLKENYGVIYDSEKYIVHYECFADNIRPVVNVLERKSAT